MIRDRRNSGRTGGAALLLGMALILAAPFPVLAQDAQEPPVDPDSEEVRVEDIEVTGRLPGEAARAYVETVAAAPPGARLARWSMPLCLGVIGARTEVAEGLIDRVSWIAEEVGVETDGPGCTPNVVVILTSDGRGTADALVRRDRDRFHIGVGNSSLSRAQLERFRTSDAAIRWWHTSAPVFADSGELAGRYRGGLPPGADAVSRGGVASPSAVRGASRMRSGVRHDLNSVTVIVDVNRLEGVSLTVLADFVAMLSLAQIDPRADFSGQNTVLNLQADPQGVEGLTDWDMDYLRALYAARPDRATAAAQEAEVARGLVRNRSERRRQDDQDQAPDDL